jgi:hypothetical protein
MQDSELWQNASAIVVPTGEAPTDIRYWKSSSLFLWMLGYEFTGTCLGCTLGAEFPLFLDHEVTVKNFLIHAVLYI